VLLGAELGHLERRAGVLLGEASDSHWRLRWEQSWERPARSSTGRGTLTGDELGASLGLLSPQLSATDSARSWESCSD
jgi:hypothetical protein